MQVNIKKLELAIRLLREYKRDFVIKDTMTIKDLLDMTVKETTTYFYCES